MRLTDLAGLRPFAARSPRGYRLHGLLRLPPGRGPFPAVVVVPGAIGAGRGAALSAGAGALAGDGVAVAGFNAAGRKGGRLDVRSGGAMDLNGERDQDDLAAVLRLLLAHPRIAWLGLYSVSFGLAAAAGCLARYPGLPVRFLIDEEGPSDCFAASLRAWTLAAAAGAPDWPGRALALFGHPCPGPEPDGPAARFWRPREPIRAIGALRCPYLRLQAEHDHVQPPQDPDHRPLFDRPPLWYHNKHAIDLVNTALSGGAPWVRVNLPRQGNPANARYDRRDPPRYIPGKMADHPALWAAAAREMVERAAP